MKIRIKNWDKKIIALLAAALLWYYVDSISVMEKEMVGQIRYIHMPAHLMAINLPPRLRYYIKTDKYYKENINPSDIYFEVSLKNAQAGTNTLPLEIRSTASLPGYVKIEVPQDQIKIFLENKVQKKVEIKPLINNTLHPSYRVESVSLIPSEVLLEGAESYLKDLKEITTEELVLKDPGIQTFKARVESIDGISKITPPTVKVKLNLVPNLISQKIYLQVKPKNLDPHLKVKRFTPHRILTRLTGTYDHLKKLDFQDLFYYIDLEKLKSPGKFKIPLEIRIPDGIEIENLGEVKGDLELMEKGEAE